MSTVSRAHQFIAAVASSSEVFMNKPVTSSIKELMTYIIAREIMETAKNGSYSGVCIYRCIYLGVTDYDCRLSPNSISVKCHRLPHTAACAISL